jgi:hypothetical protein
VNEEDEFALLVTCTSIHNELASMSLAEVLLNEDKLFVQLSDREGDSCKPCIMDFGATNHMTGERKVFSELDTRIHGTVCFRDVSMTSIEGWVMVLLQCKNDAHKALARVYLVHCLTANIVSLGQLKEDGC